MPGKEDPPGTTQKAGREIYRHIDLSLQEGGIPIGPFDIGAEKKLHAKTVKPEKTDQPKRGNWE